MSKSAVSAFCLLPFAFAFALPMLSVGAMALPDPQSILTAKLSSAAVAPEERAALTAAARDVEVHDAQFTADGVTPVSVHLLLKRASSSQSARIVDAILSSMRVFTVWYGAFPSTELVVLDAPWNSALNGASYPEVIAISSRWIAPARDMSVQRSIIGALARQYLFAAASRDANDKWFDEALVLYTGTRAIHEALENANAEAPRFFGSHLPVVIRPIQLSPNRADARPRVRHFDEIDAQPSAAWRASTAEAGSQAQRGALALHSLERFIGWPAMQQALAGYRERASVSGGSPKAFAAVVSEQRGRDLSWFFDEAFRAGATFDYAIDRLTSGSETDGDGQFRTTIALRRLGNAVFAGTNEPLRGEFAQGRAMPVAVEFGDGSGIEEYLDGRPAEKTLEYLSRSPAVSVSVDPRAVLVLDADRTNNTRRLRSSFNPIGARLALHWMVWLQDLVLSYTAFA